ncbi:helix-turn-helix transcriptional regulator [Sphingobacterium sp. HJSM2_6]|uniref:helix-turn-helix transcriptional regulator n=1 Tax=Sphingobacterium sp. HJSM2_6 TaxID=3366264 RepID=UPI003BCA3FAE
MRNRISFELSLINQESIEIQSNQFAQNSILFFSASPYIVKKSKLQQVATASIQKNFLLIEHHLLNGTALLPITIKALNEVYVLIVCVRGNISYHSKRNSSINLNLHEKEALFLFTAKGTYLALPLQYPTEILTINLLPEILPLVSSNQANLLEFIFQQKNNWLSSLQIICFKTSYLNKLKKFIAWDSRKIDLNNHLLLNIPEILLGYFKLLASKSNTILYQKIANSTQTMIHQDLQHNKIPNLFSLAKKNGIHVSTLQQSFREITGTTISKFIKSELLLRISEILIQTDIPLIEIALMFGYSDTNSLNRIFKKTFGTTMGSYRSIKLKSTFST